MPEKDGDEGKSTKSVVNKKQKQMMGEEGYDTARDMGRVRPSKDKKDATTMPPSKEMRKTQKVNKGPSALDIVKKKYKGQIMNVGKKKVKEELDLTQVAEAFGGYIIEAEVTSDADRKNRRTGRIESRREREDREARENQARQDRYGSTARDINKKYGRPPVGSDSTPDKINVKPGERDATLELIRKYQTTGTGVGGKIPDFPNLSAFRKNLKNMTTDQFKDFMDRQMGRTKDIETNTREQSKRFGAKNQQNRVTSGDERQTDKPTITYSTFTKKPKVTGGETRKTDTLFQPFRPDPEEIEKVKPKDRVTKGSGQDAKGQKDDVVTYGQSDDVPPPKPPKGTAVGAGDDRPKKPDAFSSIKKFAKKNPQIAAAGALAGYDLGKGILSKIMNLRGPGLRGGTVGRRSAGSNIAT